MLILFERSQREETEAFYRMSKFCSVQKLLNFEKLLKNTKNLLFRISYAKSIRGHNFCPMFLRFAPEHPTIQANNLNFWILIYFKQTYGCMADFVVFDFFCFKLVYIPQFSIYQKFRSSNCYYICKEALVQIWAKLDKNCDPWYVLRKIF